MSDAATGPEAGPPAAPGGPRPEAAPGRGPADPARRALALRLAELEPGPAQLARRALARRDGAAALAALDAAGPGRNPARLGLLRARALQLAGQGEAAEALLVAAMEASPSDPQPRLMLAALRAREGRPGKTLELLAPLPAGPGVLRLRLRALAALGRMAKARPLLAQATALATDVAGIEALIPLAALLHGRGPAHAEACRALLERLAACPEDAARHLAAARLHLARGDLGAFRPAAEAALAAGARGRMAAILRAELQAASAGAPPGRRRVFVLGLPETGASAVTAALARLGHLAAHGLHPLTGLPLRAEDARSFDALSGLALGEDAAALAAAWPDAVFLVTTRAFAGWAPAVQRHLRVAYGTGTLAKLAAQLARPDDTPFGPEWAAILERVFVAPGGLNAARLDHRKRMLETLRQHRPAPQRFDLHAGDGWEKLCALVGGSPPGLPFPSPGASAD